MYFRYSQLSPLGKGRGHSIEQDVLCQVWLKLAQWFWRRRFFNFVKVFSLFRNNLPLKKGGSFHLNRLDSPSPKDALCRVLLKLAQWFWRRSWKCEKFSDGWTDGRTGGRTDDRKAHLSFQLRWVKKKNPCKTNDTYDWLIGQVEAQFSRHRVPYLVFLLPLLPIQRDSSPSHQTPRPQTDSAFQPLNHRIQQTHYRVIMKLDSFHYICIIL